MIRLVVILGILVSGVTHAQVAPAQKSTPSREKPSERWGRNSEPYEPGGSYIRERNHGDMQAAVYRERFELSVCQSVYRAFCSPNPQYLPGELTRCHAQLSVCNAPSIKVDQRFLSKYGVGSISAHRDALPEIVRVANFLGQVRAWSYEQSQAPSRDGLPKFLRDRIAGVVRLSGLPSQEVELALYVWAKSFQVSRKTQFRVDYWGYFQQKWPLRHSVVKSSKTGEVESMSVSFRWCGGKHRFVVESSTILDEFVALAVFDEETLRLKSPAFYDDRCESMPDELGDYDPKNAIQKSK